MRKDNKKALTNIFTKDIYKLNNQLVSKKKVEENEGNNGDNNGNKIFIIFLPIIVPIMK